VQRRHGATRALGVSGRVLCIGLQQHALDGSGPNRCVGRGVVLRQRSNAWRRRAVLPRVTRRNSRVGSTLAVAVVLVLSSGGVATAQRFGDPLPGLTAEQLALFEDGKEEFREVETADDGLGPTFNAQSCAICHASPATGGASPARNEVRAGRQVNGAFVNLPGGTIFQIFSLRKECREEIPPEANVIAERQTQPLFGMGLVEAIPDSTIRARSDPNDADGDGISGRPGRGRFGWKAQIVSLLEFSGDAYVNEMGITNELFPDEQVPNGDLGVLAACDEVPDPEDVRDPVTGRRDIDEFENFMRFLGPPPRGGITAAVIAGEAVFNRIGCAKCHTPVMMTGPNAIAALDRKPVPLFSDLLLHDVGDTDGDGFAGDGIEQQGTRPEEIRTAPLWGLLASRPFLHDGSATSVEQAILRHAGEASAVIANFRSLSGTERDQLLAFLDSL
jgi:CxxC motif-containing protein (DUF1111 family)